MSIDPAKAKREAEMLEKLPDHVLEMVAAVRCDDTVAAFGADVLARMRDLYLSDFQAWSWVRGVLVESKVQPIGEWERRAKPAGGENNGKQGQPIEWDDPEPCADEVDGAELISGISAFIRRHVWIDEPSADALALWVPMTWIHDRLDISTFVNLTSATKRCGKSILLEVLAELVYRRMVLSGPTTEAVLFRMVEAHAPTLLARRSRHLSARCRRTARRGERFAAARLGLHRAVCRGGQRGAPLCDLLPEADCGNWRHPGYRP